MTPEQYAALVRAQVGDRYVLGAEVSPTNPDPSVFDCSELVEWSYARAGVTIRDLASNQYADTVPIADSPRIGDLLFLKNNPARPNGIGHVGIVTGPDEVVEAKGRAYGVVQTTITAWRAKSTFAGIRRYAPFTAAMMEGGTDMLKLLEAAPSGVTRIYRLYNPTTGDHLYTASVDEANTAMEKYGYTFEGKAFDLAGTVPVHRMFKDGVHHLALDAEAQTLTAQGWTNEGVLGKCSTTEGDAVYRRVNGVQHIFTTNKDESASWTLEGVAFHTGKSPAPSDANEQIATLESKLDKCAELAKQILTVTA